MLRPLSFIFGLITLAFASHVCAQAPVTTVSTAPSPPAASATSSLLPPDLEAELDALQRGVGVPSAALRASIGWRENILLSPFAPIERMFGRAELEAMYLRPMRRHWEFLSFLNGDVLRYFSPPPETGGEQQWSLHTEGRWQPISPLLLSLKATGYLRDT